MFNDKNKPEREKPISLHGMTPEEASERAFGAKPQPEQAWPFDQPPNCATISLRSIVFGGAPILHVTHDADDHGWQFLDGQQAKTANAAVVLLKEIVDLDPSVLAIADLPVGWCAWRATIDADWQRGPNPRVVG
jgi:hypothetical protein